MPLTDKTGKTILNHGLDNNQESAIEAAIDGVVERLTSLVREQQQASDNRLDELSSSVSSLGKLSDMAPKLQEIIEASGQGGSNGGAGNHNPKDDGRADDTTPDQIKELMSKIDAIEREREAERGATSARRIAEAYIEKTYPNLRGKARLIDRVAAASPSDEAAAKAAASDVLEEWSEASGSKDTESYLKDYAGVENAQDASNAGEPSHDERVAALRDRAAAEHRI